MSIINVEAKYWSSGSWNSPGSWSSGSWNRPGKNVEFGKLLPGKFLSLERNSTDPKKKCLSDGGKLCLFPGEITLFCLPCRIFCENCFIFWVDQFYNQREGIKVSGSTKRGHSPQLEALLPLAPFLPPARRKKCKNQQFLAKFLNVCPLRGYCTSGPYFWRLCAFSQKIKQLRTKYPMDLVRNVPRNSKITVLLQ